MSSYRGITIDTTKGDAYVAQQMKDIDARTTPAPAAPAPSSSPVGTGGTGSVESQIQEITNRVAGIASQIQNYTGQQSGVRIPEYQSKTPDMSSAQGRLGYYENLYGGLTSRATEVEKKIKELSKQPQTWLQALSSQPSVEEIREREYTKAGISNADNLARMNANIAELTKLNEAYTAKETEKNLAFEKSGERLAPMTFIRGEQAKIQTRYDIELAGMASNIKAKAATFEALNDNFEYATSLADQAVKDYVYDLELKRDTIKEFISLNQDMISDLRVEYRTAISDAQRLAEMRYDEAYKEKQQVMDLLLKYPTSGISISDDLDRAVQKAQRAASTPSPTSSTGYDTTSRYIQDPNNPSASIKNPLYGMKTSEINSLLSVSEAKALGVPYGTTKGQAMQMNKTPVSTGGSVDDLFDSF